MITPALSRFTTTSLTYLQEGVDFLGAQIIGSSEVIEDRLWLVLSDVSGLANVLEELLELASALALLMMVGTMFSIEALGAGTAADPD